MARPAGEVTRALLAAAEAGPGTVRELAARACAGRHAARYTCSRMLSRGELMIVTPGRPAILGLATTDTRAGPRFDALADAWRLSPIE